eukprot:TRINITY_DN11162_c0_g2_i2.p1 TRINITY_DN11162_c0_g2~~TRINITY_DN11162_c0_g2_i2.p1  ORF type:complete len:300 (-),score=46.61 TRINITY_DN11162_c0_g2_i2:212-1111(-)
MGDSRMADEQIPEKSSSLGGLWTTWQCTDVTFWFLGVAMVYVICGLVFFQQASSPLPSRAEWLYRGMLFECQVEPYLVTEAQCQDRQHCMDAGAGQPSRRLYEVPSIYSEGVPGSTLQGCESSAAGEVRCCGPAPVSNVTVVPIAAGPWSQEGCVAVRFDPRGRDAVNMERLLDQATPKKCLWLPGLTTAEGITYKSEIVVDTLLSTEPKNTKEVRDPVEYHEVMQWLTPTMFVFSFISLGLAALAWYRQLSFRKSSSAKVAPGAEDASPSMQEIQEVSNISVVVVAGTAVAAAVVVAS